MLAALRLFAKNSLAKGCILLWAAGGGQGFISIIIVPVVRNRIPRRVCWVSANRDHLTSMRWDVMGVWRYFFISCVVSICDRHLAHDRQTVEHFFLLTSYPTFLCEIDTHDLRFGGVQIICTAQLMPVPAHEPTLDRRSGEGTGKQLQRHPAFSHPQNPVWVTGLMVKIVDSKHKKQIPSGDFYVYFRPPQLGFW